MPAQPARWQAAIQAGQQAPTQSFLSPRRAATVIAARADLECLKPGLNPVMLQQQLLTEDQVAGWLLTLSWQQRHQAPGAVPAGRLPAHVRKDPDTAHSSLLP